MNRRTFLSALAAIPLAGPAAVMASTKVRPRLHWAAHPSRQLPSIREMKSAMMLVLARNPNPYCIIVPYAWHSALSLHAEQSLRNLGGVPSACATLKFSSLGIPVVWDFNCVEPRAG